MTPTGPRTDVLTIKSAPDGLGLAGLIGTALAWSVSISLAAAALLITFAALLE